MKVGAQEIVDDIEINKSEMASRLGSAEPTCEEAQWALMTIQPSDVDLLFADKQHPPYLVARIMDCVLLMFQRPLNAVEVDATRDCVKPSWSEAVMVRTFNYLLHY